MEIFALLKYKGLVIKNTDVRSYITPDVLSCSPLPAYSFLRRCKKTPAKHPLPPRFGLHSPDTNDVFLVEVKYRKTKDDTELKTLAQQITTNWPLAYLFVATHEAFYFDSCQSLVDHHPQIAPLESIWIPHEIQDKYIQILQEFEG